jgi:hypothetical protein
MLNFDATYPEQRNRVTAIFRLIVAIPHMIVAQVWGYVAELAAIPQWFIIVFTGKRNESIFEFQQTYLGYYGRVISYSALIHDVFPPFGNDVGAVPVRTDIRYEESGNRITTLFRFIVIIPAALLLVVVAIGAYVVLFISWLAILFTGKQSRGMWDFVVKFVRLLLRVQAYALLMTDTYPSYSAVPAMV